MINLRRGNQEKVYLQKIKKIESRYFVGSIFSEKSMIFNARSSFFPGYTFGRDQLNGKKIDFKVTGSKPYHVFPCLRKQISSSILDVLSHFVFIPFIRAKLTVLYREKKHSCIMNIITLMHLVA